MAQTRCSEKARRNLSFERAIMNVWHLVQNHLKARHFRKDEPAAFHLHLSLQKKKGKIKQEKLQSSAKVCCLSFTCDAEKCWVFTWNCWIQRGKEASDLLFSHLQSSSTWALLTPSNNYGNWGVWASFRHKSSARVMVSPLAAGSAHRQKCFANIYCTHGNQCKIYKRKSSVCLKGWVYIKAFAVIKML